MSSSRQLKFVSKVKRWLLSGIVAELISGSRCSSKDIFHKNDSAELYFAQTNEQPVLWLMWHRQPFAYSKSHQNWKQFFSHPEVWDLNNGHVHYSGHLDISIIQVIYFILCNKMFYGTMMLEWSVCVSDDPN